MDEKDNEAPFPREPWKRLLEDSAEGPPETTDARIRAAARRDLAPRGRRWWLPASLAASFVLAVLIVQSQIGTGGRATVRESDRGAGPAMQGRIVDRNEAQQAREPGRSPDVAAERASPVEDEPALDEYGYADSEFASEAGGSGARVGGPEHELKAASDLDAAEAPQPAAPAEAESLESPEAGPGNAAGASLVQPAAKPRAPEAWYAEIEALRKAGRNAEADAELAKFEAAYPDWIKQRGRHKP